MNTKLTIKDQSNYGLLFISNIGLQKSRGITDTWFTLMIGALTYC